MDTATDRISWFPVPDEADLPPELQGLFRAARERIGFVPNVFRAYSFRPERLSAWFAHFRAVMEDRKSTRLNSSHANISYAVFCLKKKNFDVIASLVHSTHPEHPEPLTLEHHTA